MDPWRVATPFIFWLGVYAAFRWLVPVLRYVGLWLEARLVATERQVPFAAPEFEEVNCHPQVFEAVANGTPLELMGKTIRKPAVAIGKVLARQTRKRVAPGTSQFAGHWFGLEFNNQVRQAYGYRDRRGWLHVGFKSTSFSSTEWGSPSVGGHPGQPLLIVYDLRGWGHVALSLAAQPTRRRARPPAQ